MDSSRSCFAAPLVAFPLSLTLVAATGMHGATKDPNTHVVLILVSPVPTAELLMFDSSQSLPMGLNL